MRLSAIRLAGFKSFVDKTQLLLPSNLTAVVGPNGCGKSNLIDAVRWVLGESSAKQLRGAALSDVIFNGSRTRKPVGRAMIELVFDNSDATIEGPYAQYGEIAVRRELSRDGNSQFYINGTRCRRKDITELFLGTGLGGRNNYAIIEQGTVSRLIEAQPEELRQMLEESAGISRYKEKRRETETRIRHTRENLERLTDLLSEIDERLAKLQRQAGAAQRFKRYKQEQRELRRQLLGLRWRELDGEHQALQNRLKTLQTNVDEADARLKDAIVERSRSGAAAELGMQATQDAQAQFYAADGDLIRAQQELRHAEDMQRMRDKESQDLLQESQRLAQQCEARLQQVQQVSKQMEDLQRQLVDAQEELGTAQQGLGGAESQAVAEAAELDRLRQALQNPRTVAATEKVRLEQLGRQLERSAAREQQCQNELATIDLGAIDKQMQAAEQAQLAANVALESSDEQAGLSIKRVEQARGARAECDLNLHESRKHAQSVHARLATLSAEQSRALREDDRGQEDWLKQRGWGKAKPLGRVLKVDAQWEKAVEAVLGPWLQAPCVDGDVLASQVETNQPLLLIGTHVDAAWQPPAQSLAACVQGPLGVRKMLSSIYLLQDAPAIAEQVAALPHGAALVSAEGHLYWSGLAQRNGDAAKSGVLLRERLLAEVQKEDLSAQQALLSAEEAQSGALSELKAAEAAQQNALRELDQSRRQHAEARSVAANLVERQQALNQRMQQRQQELTEVLALKAELSQDRDSAAAALQASQSQIGDLEQQEVAQRLKSDNARAALQDLRHRLQNLQRQTDHAREKRAVLASELAAAEAARDALLARKDDVERSLRDTQQQHTTVLDPIPGLKAAVDAAQLRKQTADSSLRQARTAQESASAAARAATDGVSKSEQSASHARSLKQEQQLTEQRLLARRDGLDEQIREAGARIEEILAALDPELKARACEEELESLETRIQRLGAVNLAAVEEYDEEKERADYLRVQEADLNDALGKLEDAIRQIDKETRARFRATFEAVNDKFKARFPKLFGGGEAYLELTGEDVLDAGVRVMARPPGKRNATIQLLSGGEKAMTAVALVFALFELNPAPFCMLDEVDAPLDDANVVRYCEVVRAMSEHVQFIIVTHNKVTMELANQLNGVTMQEPGVSRLVSVDVQEAVALAG